MPVAVAGLARRRRRPERASSQSSSGGGAARRLPARAVLPVDLALLEPGDLVLDLVDDEVQRRDLVGGRRVRLHEVALEVDRDLAQLVVVDPGVADLGEVHLDPGDVQAEAGRASPSFSRVISCTSGSTFDVLAANDDLHQHPTSSSRRGEYAPASKPTPGAPRVGREPDQRRREDRLGDPLGRGLVGPARTCVAHPLQPQLGHRRPDVGRGRARRGGADHGPSSSRHVVRP